MDDDYDDEIEIEEEPKKVEEKIDGISITINDSAMEAMASAVCTALVNRFDQRISQKVEKAMSAAIRSKVDEAASKIIGERAEAVIRELVEKPRRQTDMWGNPSGPTVAFADLIPGIAENYMNQRVNEKGEASGYSGDKLTRFNWLIASMVRGEVDKAARDAAGKVTEAARKVVQEHVGRFVAEQLVPAIELKKA